MTHRGVEEPWNSSHHHITYFLGTLSLIRIGMFPLLYGANAKRQRIYLQNSSPLTLPDVIKAKQVGVAAGAKVSLYIFFKKWFFCNKYARK